MNNFQFKRDDEEKEVALNFCLNTFKENKEKFSFKLDPEKKKQWVEALRSGKYSQTIGFLKLVNKEENTCLHCCLGVYAEAIENAPQKERDNFPSILFWPEGYKEDNNTVYDCYLPNEIMDKNLQYHLSVFNDEGATFQEIAQIIEELL